MSKACCDLKTKADVLAACRRSAPRTLHMHTCTASVQCPSTSWKRSSSPFGTVASTLSDTCIAVMLHLSPSSAVVQLKPCRARLLNRAVQCLSNF